MPDVFFDIDDRVEALLPGDRELRGHLGAGDVAAVGESHGWDLVGVHDV